MTFGRMLVVYLMTNISNMFLGQCWRLKTSSRPFNDNDLRALVTEIFKVKNDLAPDIMKDVFELKEPPYNLRSESNPFTRRNVKTTYYGPSSVST